MSKFATHLCMVSTQPVPNLVAACDPQHKPEKIILLTSDKMRRYAEWLGQVLAGRGVASEIWPVSNPYAFVHIRQRLETLLQRPDMDDIALNATGGTRIMSLAAHELFSERKLPIFFVQPHKDLFLQLHPSGPGLEISDELKLEEFLQAHGYRIRNLRRETVARNRHQLGLQLLKNLEVFERALGTINYLAGTAEGRNPLESDPITGQHWGVRGFKELVDLFTDEGLLEKVSNQLCFASEADRFFVNGGWLEEYLFARIGRLCNRLKMQDVAMSIVVESPSGTRNEIDLAILFNNRLHLIECKTRKFIDSGGAGTKTLYRMESLRDFGGLTSQAMLASYRKVGYADRRRAKDLGIELVTGNELEKVERRMSAWLQKL